MSNLTPLTSQDFSDATAADGVVLVDFWAKWCGPCRQVAPVLDQLAGLYEGKASFYALDLDEHGDVAAQLRITSVPTVVVYRNGEVVDSITGARPRAVYQAAVDEALTA